MKHVHPAGERDVAGLRRRELDHHGFVQRQRSLIFKDGNTTSVPHVLSVVRTNVMRAGTPARSVTFAGSYPCSFTRTFAVWAASLLRPSLDEAALSSHSPSAAGLRPRRSRSALTKKLPSVTTTSPG